ncbi:MAG: hypothetical protein MUF72_01305 [Elainella sp. Prado103]|jgi:hypothetical protein|nr:hypothetical protein [Elainella sp. Prado103]
MFQRFALATLLTTGALTWYQQHQTPVLLTTRSVEVNPLQFLADHQSDASNPSPTHLTQPEPTEATALPAIFQQIEAALRVKL